MKTPTIKWLVAGAVGAGMLALATGAIAAGNSGTTGAAGTDVSQPSQHLQLTAKECGGVVKASAMKDDKMASDAMKDDKMAKDAAMKTDKMADDKMAKDVAMKDDKMATEVAMKDDKMAKDAMKTDTMAKAGDCADKG